MNAFTTILTIVGSGAFLTFLQFLISRHDEKAGKKADLSKKLDEIKTQILATVAAVDGKVDELAHTVRLNRKAELRKDILTYVHFADDGTISATEKKDLYEQIDEYHELKGDGYIDAEIERLKKEGKI